MDFANVYDDARRAEAYARLEFPATYHLAFRDIPEILRAHVTGTRALDFGCGAGRSARFLARLGFATTGIDISAAMVAKAREADPDGDYRVGDPGDLPAASFDLVFSAFTFDNVAMERKPPLFTALRRLLDREGRIVSIVSAAELYVNEWASFSTKDFAGNRTARCGDLVRTVMLDVEDRRPVDDIFCADADYLEIYRRAGLAPVRAYRPLGRDDEPWPWVNETRIAPWVIWVLEAADAGGATE